MREIIVRFCFDDTEKDLHPQIIVEHLIRDEVGFDILADTARVDESIPENLSTSENEK